MNLTPQQEEAVNRRVHEVTHPGECWHEYSYVTGQGLGTSCTKCDRVRVRNPNYWRDANACLNALNEVSPWGWSLANFIVTDGCYSALIPHDPDPYESTGKTWTQAMIGVILATVGESVESVIEKAGKTNG